MMEMELVSEMSEFINYLMWLSAREHFIEFCRRESLKTYITNLYRECRGTTGMSKVVKSCYNTKHCHDESTNLDSTIVLDVLGRLALSDLLKPPVVMLVNDLVTRNKFLMNTVPSGS
jgi:hypothetical protein